MRDLHDSPEVRELLEAARREGYAAGLSAVNVASEAARQSARIARRALWAAAMTSGGTLRIGSVYMKLLGAGDPGELQEAYDPATDDTVLTARPAR